MDSSWAASCSVGRRARGEWLFRDAPQLLGLRRRVGEGEQELPGRADGERQRLAHLGEVAELVVAFDGGARRPGGPAAGRRGARSPRRRRGAGPSSASIFERCRWRRPRPPPSERGAGPARSSPARPGTAAPAGPARTAADGSTSGAGPGAARWRSAWPRPGDSATTSRICVAFSRTDISPRASRRTRRRAPAPTADPRQSGGSPRWCSCSA